jgi:protein-arginine kinase activator protein McsA
MSDLLCNSCDKQKATLKLVKSKVLPGFPLYMCETCIRAGYEPRYVIILAGRRFGTEAVKTHILKRKYHGRDISFSEIVRD